MISPSPVPAIPFVERLRSGVGRRALSIGLALLIEGLLLLLLLSLGSTGPPGVKEGSITVVTLSPDEAPEKAPEPSSAEREQQAEKQPEPQQPATEQPLPPQPAEPKAAPIAPALAPPPPEPPRPALVPPSPARPAPSGRALYGPPDRRSPSSRDTERVGTAPNGEPLYAAAWYREPGAELGAYLSTARGPGWGLIACRTAPAYRVEDCVGIAEYPEGSQINRAVLAAAWEFKVRPPQLGGRPLVGSWVRIRIDYHLAPR